MGAGGELAALMGQIGKSKVAGDDNEVTPTEPSTDDEEDEDDNMVKEVREEIAIATQPTPAGRLPPRASPPSSATAAIPKPPTPIAELIEEPVKSSAPMQNEELKAKFDERNLEAGIPTPSFLQDMRKNLKKPGERSRSSTPLQVGTATTTTTASVSSSSSSVVAAKSNDKQELQLASQSTCSSDNNAKVVDEKDGAKKNNIVQSVSDSSSHHDTLKDRRTRMVAARGVNTSAILTSSARATTSNSSNTNINTNTDTVEKPQPPKSSPTKNRREKLLARVRAHNAKHHTVDTTSTSSDPAVQFDTSKTSIISPKQDEYEVLFADDNFVPNPYLTEETNTGESLDSIGNEIEMPAGGMATMPTSNIQPRVKISMTNAHSSNSKSKDGGDSTLTTPEKSRIQNASTPKIRGNSCYRRDQQYNDDEVGDDMLPPAVERVPSGGGLTNQQNQLTPIESSPLKQQQKLPSFQEQIESDNCSTDLQLATPRRNSSQLQQNDFSQAYPMRQSPSQLSQMSGLTTPSCFPQEYSAPMGQMNIHQPLLIGGGPTIHESTSFHCGSSAISSGKDENPRLKEQLDMMQKRLDEKDAIISQLMKRIGDLEMSNSTARGVAQAQHSFSMDQSNPHGGLTSPASVSSSLFSGQSSSAFHQPTSTRQRSNSADTESACLSMPSSAHILRQQSTSSKQSSILKEPIPQRRGRSGSMKASPITTDTSSTASITTSGSTPQRRGHSGSMKASSTTTAASSTARITTSGSNKSGKRAPRSKSAGRTRRGASSRSQKLKKETDDRKFVC